MLGRARWPKLKSNGQMPRGIRSRLFDHQCRLHQLLCHGDGTAAGSDESREIRGLTRRSGKRTIWNGVVREDRLALDIPLRWKKPKKIFVNSMSDLFHEGVSDEFILQVWQVMRDTPHHHYQILTKRPERMGASCLPDSGCVAKRLAGDKH